MNQLHKQGSQVVYKQTLPELIKIRLAWLQKCFTKLVITGEKPHIINILEQCWSAFCLDVDSFLCVMLF